jgi:hypothetical protein
VIGPNGTMVREGVLTKEEAERDVSTRNTPTSMAFVTHPRMWAAAHSIWPGIPTDIAG